MSDRLQRIMLLLQKELPELRRRYGVKSLALFGSYARGEEEKRSDLDILVEFEERPITLFEFIRLEGELSRLLGVKVDLVEKSALKPVMGKQILQEAMPIALWET